MDIEQDIQVLTDTINKFSPIVASALTGNYAATIIDFLHLVFGGSGSPADLSNKITNDQDAKEKLQRIEDYYQLEAQGIASDEKDSENARDFEARIINTKYGWIIAFISVTYTLAFVGYLFASSFNYIPKDASLLTILSMMAYTVMHNFMGPLKKG